MSRTFEPFSQKNFSAALPPSQLPATYVYNDNIASVSQVVVNSGNLTETNSAAILLALDVSGIVVREMPPITVTARDLSANTDTVQLYAYDAYGNTVAPLQLDVYQNLLVALTGSLPAGANALGAVSVSNLQDISGITVLTDISGQTVVTDISGQTVVTDISGQTILVGNFAELVLDLSGQFVHVDNFPLVQDISGAVSVSNLQDISGITVVTDISGQTTLVGNFAELVLDLSGQFVHVDNFPVSQAVTVSGCPPMQMLGSLTQTNAFFEDNVATGIIASISVLDSYVTIELETDPGFTAGQTIILTSVTALPQLSGRTYQIDGTFSGPTTQNLMIYTPDLANLAVTAATGVVQSVRVSPLVCNEFGGLLVDISGQDVHVNNWPASQEVEVSNLQDVSGVTVNIGNMPHLSATTDSVGLYGYYNSAPIQLAADLAGRLLTDLSGQALALLTTLNSNVASLLTSLNMFLPTFSYAGNPYSLVANDLISPDIEPTKNMLINTWSVSPALPSGMALDTDVGTITGTPSYIDGVQHIYAITAYSTLSGLVASYNLELTITQPPPILILTSQSESLIWTITTDIAHGMSGAGNAFTISGVTTAGRTGINGVWTTSLTPTATTFTFVGPAGTNGSASTNGTVTVP